MKSVDFLGDSLARLRGFSPVARSRAGFQLGLVQAGEEPDDWKPMPTIGPGVREIRVRDATGAYRVVYVASLPDRVVALHAFQKKTQQTAHRDIELAAARLRALKE